MLVDFHSLFERYSRDVYRFALYLSGDPSLAEEIAQETFVRAWVTPDEIRAGTVKGYLLTIARHLFLAEGRRRGRQVALDAATPDPQPGAEVVVSGRLELAAVLEALQLLPETDRAALLMHVQDDLPYAEIARALGLSLTAVKVRVHRARLKLRQSCDPKGA
jgi:RNA polymerase sigma-70 factor (ECF subfamily)